MQLLRYLDVMSVGPCGCELMHVVLCGAAYTEIRDAIFYHQLGIIEITTIYNDGIAHQSVETLQVKTGELRPIRENQQSIHIFGGCVCIGYVLQT